MPLSFDGAGTITGLQVGGLPDGTVDQDTLATDSVSTAKIVDDAVTSAKYAISVAVLVDEKAENTDGGTFTSGAWQTRDLNTEVSDPDGIVTIASNQFTLGAGTYLIAWECPAYRVQFNQSRLFDVTGSAAVEGGMSNYAESTSQFWGVSNGSAVVSPTSSNVYEIQHFAHTTRNSDGFGVRGSAGAERYTRVTITKLS